MFKKIAVRGTYLVFIISVLLIVVSESFAVIEVITEDVQLLPSNVATNTLFGIDVAIDGNTMVVSAANQTAYVFEFDSVSWQEVAMPQNIRLTC